MIERSSISGRGSRADLVFRIHRIAWERGADAGVPSNQEDRRGVGPMALVQREPVRRASRGDEKVYPTRHGRSAAGAWPEHGQSAAEVRSSRSPPGPPRPSFGSSSSSSPRCPRRRSFHDEIRDPGAPTPRAVIYFVLSAVAGAWTTMEESPRTFRSSSARINFRNSEIFFFVLS